MQTTNRFLDDLAKVANGAVSTLTGVKAEIDALVRQRLERLLAGMDLVAAEEFEAVRAMAAKARAEQERLEKRIAHLESRLGVAPARKAAAPGKGAAKAKTKAKTKKVAAKSKPAAKKKAAAGKKPATKKKPAAASRARPPRKR